MKVTKSHSNRLKSEIVAMNEILSLAAQGMNKEQANVNRALSRQEAEEFRMMKAKGLGILYMADALDLVYRRDFKAMVTDLRENLHAVTDVLDKYAAA